MVILIKKTNDLNFCKPLYVFLFVNFVRHYIYWNETINVCIKTFGLSYRLKIKLDLDFCVKCLGFELIKWFTSMWTKLPYNLIIFNDNNGMETKKCEFVKEYQILVFLLGAHQTMQVKWAEILTLISCICAHIFRASNFTKKC